MPTRWMVAIVFAIVASPVFAAFHGSVIGGKTVINVPLEQFANLLKGIDGMSSGDTQPWPGKMNADGYPASADLTSSVGGNYPNPFSNYYGHYTYTHTGCGSLSLSTGAIIYSGGAAISNSTLLPTPGANTGSTLFDFPIWSASGANCNPSIEFAYGALIGTIANNGGGKVRITSTIATAFTNFATGTFQINNINGITPGLYALTKVDNSNMDILSLTFNGGTMTVNGGNPGVASEIIFAPTGQGGFTFVSGHTTAWTMSNAILCRTGDLAYIQAGHQYNPDFIAQLRDTLKPGFARFMDPMLTNEVAHPFASRPKNSNLTFMGQYNSFSSLFWVGAVAHGASDAYTSSNPSGSPASGAYLDGEVVQGQVDIANTGNTPTLALSGRSGGAKPILSAKAIPEVSFVSGTPVVGDVIHFTATATYLGGGAHTADYTLISGDTVTSTLAQHLCNTVNGDATFAAANIVCSSAFGSVFIILYNRNGQGVAPGPATVFTYTVTGTGSEALAIGTMLTVAQDPLGGIALVANEFSTFRYSKILDAWIFYNNGSSPTNGGYSNGVSIEAMTDLCNQASVGCWLNIPEYYSGADATSMVQTAASNLNTALALEYSNEVWNTAATPTQQDLALGVSLGFTFGSAITSYDSYYGSRFKQYADLSAAAWTGAGKSRASLNMILADALVVYGSAPPQDSSVNRLNGGTSVTTNLTYNALGGLGGTAGSNYNTFPNRPVDAADALSVASYWTGVVIQQMAGNFAGTQLTFNSFMQAGLDYASGIPANMASAIQTFDTDARNAIAGFVPYYTNLETVMASYDSQRTGAGMAILNRFDYEGGSDDGFGDGFAGTSTADATPHTGYPPLSAQLTSNVTGGWNISAYGASSDIVAQQTITAWLAWKNSSLFQATVTATLQQLVTASPTRQVKGAWYGYNGPSVWRFYPGSIYTTPQQSYNAFANWH